MNIYMYKRIGDFATTMKMKPGSKLKKTDKQADEYSKTACLGIN